MKVLKPSKNALTQGYSSKHKGYDHSGRGDKNYYSSFHGVIVQAKNSETKNWINNGTLTTNDYGNYLKLKAQVDGKTVYQLGAHFQPGTVLPKGTEVKKGQVIAQIGNTGNSTGAHSHTEYRDEDNQNFSVDFVDEDTETDNGNNMEAKQQIIDAYLGTRPNQPPSDDEISARLQQNKNLVEILKDILGGDGKSREYWLSEWDVDQSGTDWRQTAEQYKQTYEDLKTILGLSPADNTEDVHGKVKGLLERIKELEKQQEPKVIYKYEGKDYQKALNIFGLTLIIEKK